MPGPGNRVWGSEASSIDTALAVAGALLAARYYPGTEIEKLAREIYERVNWKWMMNNSDFICMGWTPESKFLPYYWDSYNELMLLVALAVGSPTFPVPPRRLGALAASRRRLQQSQDHLRFDRLSFHLSVFTCLYRFPESG